MLSKIEAPMCINVVRLRDYLLAPDEVVLFDWLLVKQAYVFHFKPFYYFAAARRKRNAHRSPTFRKDGAPIQRPRLVVERSAAERPRAGAGAPLCRGLPPTARVREISALWCAVFRVEVINLLRRGIFVQGGARRMQKSSNFCGVISSRFIASCKSTVISPDSSKSRPASMATVSPCNIATTTVRNGSVCRGINLPTGCTAPPAHSFTSVWGARSHCGLFAKQA